MSEGELVESSAAGERLLHDFGHEQVLKKARECVIDVSDDIGLVQLANVNSRQRYLGMETVTIRFTAKQYNPSLVLVYLQRLPLYDDLRERNELLEFLIQTIPRGVALHRINPATGETTHPVVNKKMAELCGVENVADMVRMGSPVVTTVMPEEERLYVERVVTDAYRDLSAVSFTVNTLRASGEYKPTKFWLQCYTDDNGMLQGTAMAEDSAESDVEPSAIKRSVGLMLSSFLSAVFDVSFYVNSKFQFTEETPRVRYFFHSDPAAPSLVGMPLEALMALDEDKFRFREYMVRSLEGQGTPATSSHTVAPMIKLRLATANNVVSDCEVFATPTFQSFTRDEPFNDSQPAYLVGIRVLRAQRNLPESLEMKRESSVSRKTPFMSLIPEEEESSETGDDHFSRDVGRTSLASSARSWKSFTDTHQDAIPTAASELAGSLLRDISFSMMGLVDAAQEAPRDQWLVPSYKTYDWIVVQQELIWSLPNHLQADFVNATQQLNFSHCAQLLRHTTEGNADILHGANLTKNPHIIITAIRFFMGFCSQLDFENAHQLLTLINQQISLLASIMVSPVDEHMIQLQFTLQLISVAQKYTVPFSTTTGVEWLRKSFMCSLSQHSKCEAKLKTLVLPIVYFTCLLWGGLMQAMIRTGEAVSILTHIHDDMERFRHRHPFGIVTRQIQACLCYNLSLSHLVSGSVDIAFLWLSNLQNHMDVPQIDLPTPCYDLVSWVEAAQARSQGSGLPSEIVD
jgi:hypothetical protein